jgi:hypothetical protein
MCGASVVPVSRVRAVAMLLLLVIVGNYSSKLPLLCAMQLHKIHINCGENRWVASKVEMRWLQTRLINPENRRFWAVLACGAVETDVWSNYVHICVTGVGLLSMLFHLLWR